MTPLKNLIQDLRNLKQNHRREVSIDDVLKVAHLYRIHEREILIEAFDEGYKSGKKIMDTSGKDYYLFNFTKTK